MFCKRRMRLLDFHSFLNGGYNYCEFMLVLIWKKDLFSKHIMLSFTLLAHSRALSSIFGNLYETISYLAKKFQVIVMGAISALFLFPIFVSCLLHIVYFTNVVSQSDVVGRREPSSSGALKEKAQKSDSSEAQRAWLEQGHQMELVPTVPGQ